MKKSFIFVALAGLALSSCVNDENQNVVETAQQPLAFGTPVMNIQTKGNVMGEIEGTSYPSGENFMVYCKAYTGNFNGWTNSADASNYFAATGEETVNSNPSSGSKYWNTATTHYWPEATYQLAFAAYSPSDVANDAESIEHTAAGLQIAGFQTNSEADMQYDLMFSNREYNLNKNNNGSSSVKIKFNHALSSIVFSAQRGQEDINYNITHLKLIGSFYQKGDFSQGIVETPAISGGAYAEAATPAWSNLTENTSITYEPSFNTFEVPHVDPLQFTKGTSALLLIPQTLPADAKVILYYDEITNKGKASEKTLSYEREINLSEFATEQGVKVNTWEMGKRYVYRIAFGASNPIYFEPSISDWEQLPTLIYTIN